MQNQTLGGCDKEGGDTETFRPKEDGGCVEGGVVLQTSDEGGGREGGWLWVGGRGTLQPSRPMERAGRCVEGEEVLKPSDQWRGAMPQVVASNPRIVAIRLCKHQAAVRMGISGVNYSLAVVPQKLHDSSCSEAKANQASAK